VGVGDGVGELLGAGALVLIDADAVPVGVDVGDFVADVLAVGLGFGALWCFLWWPLFCTAVGAPGLAGGM
jgi:hypothetical protein